MQGSGLTTGQPGHGNHPVLPERGGRPDGTADVLGVPVPNDRVGVKRVAVAVEARDLNPGAVEPGQIGFRHRWVCDDLVDLGNVRRGQETAGIDLDAVQPEVGDHLDRILQWAVMQNCVVDAEFHRFTCFPLSMADRATAARISMLWTPSSKDALRGRDSSFGIPATSSRKARA